MNITRRSPGLDAMPLTSRVAAVPKATEAAFAPRHAGARQDPACATGPEPAARHNARCRIRGAGQAAISYMFGFSGAITPQNPNI